MSSRTDLARRLELAQVQEVGDLVTGHARGMAVTLEGEAPFTACVVELGAAVPIARMVMRPGDLNHPDAVETGDGEFDEVMQVTALASYAPTLQKLLDQPLRSALLEFLVRHPSAEFNGSRLRVPAEGGVTQQLVIDALTIADAVAKRFAVIGFLESEAPTRLPADEAGRAFARLLALTAAGTGAVFLLFAWSSGAEADAFWVAAGAMVVGISVMALFLARNETR